LCTCICEYDYLLALDTRWGRNWTWLCYGGVIYRSQSKKPSSAWSQFLDLTIGGPQREMASDLFSWTIYLWNFNNNVIIWRHIVQNTVRITALLEFTGKQMQSWQCLVLQVDRMPTFRLFWQILKVFSLSFSNTGVWIKDIVLAW
jgi:hypothetical protein